MYLIPVTFFFLLNLFSFSVPDMLSAFQMFLCWFSCHGVLLLSLCSATQAFSISNLRIIALSASPLGRKTCMVHHYHLCLIRVVHLPQGKQIQSLGYRMLKVELDPMSGCCWTWGLAAEQVPQVRVKGIQFEPLQGRGWRPAFQIRLHFYLIWVLQGAIFSWDVGACLHSLKPKRARVERHHLQAHRKHMLLQENQLSCPNLLEMYTFQIFGFRGRIRNKIAWQMRCHSKVRLQAVIFIELDPIPAWRLETW